MGISVSGLSSGFNWQSMVEQLREVENQRITLLEKQKTTYNDKLSAWQTVNSYISGLQSAANDLKTSSSFSLFNTSLTSSSSTVDAEDILSATTTSSATKGTYKVVVSNMAQEEKLASNSYSSMTSALGLSGSILVNGKALSIDSGDTLQDIQTAFNSANSGTNASGVVASILKESTGGYRLILTSETEGAAGIGLLSGSSGDTILADLGLNDGGTTIKNAVTNGARSDRFLDSTTDPVASTSVADLMGISAWSGNVTINGQAVNIDLSKTLSGIQSDLNAAGLSAQVVKETEGGSTYYSLQVANMTGSSYTDANNVLETLGFIKGTHGDVVGVTGGTANTTYDSLTQTQSAITGSTLIKDIYGYLSNDPANDKVTISGTNHSGTGVTTTDFAITATSTMQDLLNQIETVFGDVTASVTGDGKIEVVDNASGTSQLSVTLGTTLTDASSTLDFGTFTSVGTVRKRTLQAGEDAAFTIDGTAMTSTSNTVTTAIPGVTLKLQGEDPSATITVNVDQDSEGIEGKVNSFIDSYNQLMSYIKTQMTYDTDTGATGGPLFGDNTLKSIKSQIQSSVLSEVGSDDLSYLTDIGITIDKNGLLSLDSDTFQEKLETDFDDVVNLFADSGTSTVGGVSYSYSSRSTKSGTYNITFTQASGSGTSVAGTIDGVAGTGSGNTLILQGSSSSAEGLQITYDGTAAPVSGTFTFTRGIASLVEALSYNMTDSIDGTVTTTETGIEETIDKMDEKIDSTTDQIDRKMALLTSQFQNMEAALSEMQALSSYLSTLLSSAS